MAKADGALDFRQAVAAFERQLLKDALAGTATISGQPPHSASPTISCATSCAGTACYRPEVDQLTVRPTAAHARRAPSCQISTALPTPRGRRIARTRDPPPWR